MKRLLFTLILFSCVFLNIGECGVPVRERFSIGRFIVYKDSQGYQATDMYTYSEHYKTAYKAIMEIQ